MIKMTIQDAEETAEFKVLEKPIIQKPLIAESDVVTIDNNLSTYVTGTQKRELTVGLGYLDSVGYETLRRIRDRQYAVLKYPTVTITADEPVDLGYGEDVPDYRQRLVQLKGKNLWDKDEAALVNTWQASGSTYSTGVLTVPSSGTSGVSYASLGWFTFEEGKTYALSFNTNGDYYQLRLLTSENSYPSTGAGTATTTTRTLIYTPVTTETLKLACYTVVGTGKTCSFSNIQIEVGTAPTDYEAYYNIELCKIGDYKDYIYKNEDKWYVHKECGSSTKDITIAGIASDNTSGATKVSAEGAFILFAGDWGNDYATTAGQARISSNIGTYKLDANVVGNTGAREMENGTFCQRQGTNDRLYFRNTSYIGKTGNEVKAVLSANSGGANLWWHLATPTETEITNETLIAQLDALQNSAFDRWTGVETVVQEPSLQPYLTVTQGEITGSGKEVMLDGTTEDLLDFVILGDTYQQTYTGKNLFKLSSDSALYGITMTKNSDGTVNIHGTNTYSGELLYTAYVPASLFENGATYTLSNTKELVGGLSARCEVYNDTTWLRAFVSTNARTAALNLSNGNRIRIAIVIARQANINIDNIGFQLEKSSSATSFEPYVGSAPSPSPDYPQEVQTVNGDIAFDFSGPSGVKRYTMVGKMTIADQRIVDNCGTNEQVQVSFRESKQI